jgi:hypothetical protein
VTPPNGEQTPDRISLDTAFPEAESREPEAEEEVEEEVEADADPPQWVQQASLTEVLLWRLGIPLDRERMQREHERSQKLIDLEPPITTRKVADAIAQLSMQVIRGELDAATAKTSLYALQTLLTALRLQIIEEKKPKDTTKKKALKPAPTRKPRAKQRRKQIAKPKR